MSSHVMDTIMWICAYGTFVSISLLYARRLYGRWRIEETEKRAGVRPRADGKVWPDRALATLAFFVGFTWWLVLPVQGLVSVIGWLIMSDPPQAPHEAADRLAQQEGELARLERENGIPPLDMGE